MRIKHHVSTEHLAPSIDSSFSASFRSLSLSQLLMLSTYGPYHTDLSIHVHDLDQFRRPLYCTAWLHAISIQSMRLFYLLIWLCAFTQDIFRFITLQFWWELHLHYWVTVLSIYQWQSANHILETICCQTKVVEVWQTCRSCQLPMDMFKDMTL